jgi:hypothetical protein
MKKEMPMSQDAIQVIKHELARISVTEEQGWLEYLPLAARLAALGDSEPLARWPELVRPFGGRLEPLLVERSEEGIWDLQQSLGKDLGLAVIDAQDFFCFLRRDRNILPTGATRMLVAWTEEAERTALDEEAALTLRKFLRRFPLPTIDRLVVVDMPISFAEESILAAAARPCPIVDFDWPPLPSSTPALADVYQLDAGTPSDRLKRCFERLDVGVDMPLLGKLAVSRRIDDHWRVVIDIERDDGMVPEVEMVRLGRLPGHLAVDAPGRWLVDLRPWEHLQRVRMMEAPLVVGFHNGYRLRVK